jgi:chromosomal replication initiation ATPase DnaA
MHLSYISRALIIWDSQNHSGRILVKQLLLPLDLPPTFEAKDFIVSKSNEEAYLWLIRWPNWPNRTLSIYGDEGCGKTHLSHIWQCYSESRHLTGIDFNETALETLLEGPALFLIDDAHLIEKEEKFFHFYNHILQSKGGLLLLSTMAPAYWDTYLPDLRSRLNAIPAFKIHPPDEDLLSQVIKKQFSDLQITVDDTVIAYLLKHMERSFESARMWVDILNKRALTQQKSITIPLVREVLQSQCQDETCR